MRDIEFLEKSKWDKSEVFFYFIEDGFLKKFFREDYSQYCKENNLPKQEFFDLEDAKVVCKSIILGKVFYLLDTNLFKYDVSLSLIKILYNQLSKKGVNHKYLIYIDKNSKLYEFGLKLSKFKQVKIIEESSKKSKVQVGKVIKYVLKYNDIYDVSKLKNKDVFDKNIIDIVSEGSESFWEILNRIDLVLLNCISENDLFDLLLAKGLIREKHKEYFLNYRLLGDLLLIEDKEYSFLQYVFQVILKDDKKKYLLISNWYLILKELFLINSIVGDKDYFNSLSSYKKRFFDKYRKIPIKKLSNFSFLLSEYESKFKVDDFKYNIDVMISEFKSVSNLDWV
jgi:hypothetical protein